MHQSPNDEKTLYATRKWAGGLLQSVGWFLITFVTTTVILVIASNKLSSLGVEGWFKLLTIVPLLALIGIGMVTMHINLAMTSQSIKVNLNGWKSQTIKLENIAEVIQTESPGPKSGYGQRIIDYGDMGYLVGGPAVKVTLNQKGTYRQYFIISVKNPDEVISWFNTVKEINSHGKEKETRFTAE